MDFDKKVKYQKSHEWVRKDGDCIVVGISDYAQDSLGDIAYVDLPDPGAEFNRGDVFGFVESVKAASDVFLPVGGKIIEVNGELADSPEVINVSPFDKGWMIKIKADNEDELNDLLTANEYESYVQDLEVD